MTAAALRPHCRRPGWRWLQSLLLVAAALLFGAAGARADDVQPVPKLTDRVIDDAGLLGSSQRQALIDKLAQFEQQTGAQVVVLTVPTTAPEDIASYAQRVGDAWKIGRKDVGDGLLLVVAKNDHTVFVATTKALEGAVPDLAAHEIIDNAIVPAFRQGDFAGGLNAGLDQLMARIRGEALPAPSAPAGRAGAAPRRGGIDTGQLAMFFFIAVPVIGGVLSALLGRRLGSVATAAGAGGIAWVLGAGGVLAVIAGVVALVIVGVLGVGSRGRGLGGGMPIIWGGGGFGGGGSGGWGGGGGGGGGFSSGGGGDFGGGGASGRW
jgi:uncharacterized protein